MNALGPLVRLLNKKRITLNYEIKDVGPSGVSGVELWYTRDAKNWTRQRGQAGNQAAIHHRSQGRGALRVHAADGEWHRPGKDPPASGDQPQVWAKVDLTRLTVAFTEVQAGYADKAPAITILMES